jgi:hypothetical protein
MEKYGLFSVISQCFEYKYFVGLLEAPPNKISYEKYTNALFTKWRN